MSRPSRTRLITCFLYIYKIFKKQFISLHIWLLKYPHALKEENLKNAVYLLKAFCFTVDYKSRKLKSKLYVSLAANKSKSIKQEYTSGKKNNSPFESLICERKQSAGLASSHSLNQM